MSTIQFDLTTATSSLDALQGICRDSVEALHNITVLRAMVIDADYTINQLTRALRAEVESPTHGGYTDEEVGALNEDELRNGPYGAARQ